MLATTNGRFVALTTPYGKRGWFYDAWEYGEGWHRTKVTAHDCLRIDPEWLAEERQLIIDWQFRQEYLCDFVDTDEQFFASDPIEAAQTGKTFPEDVSDASRTLGSRDRAHRCTVHCRLRR